MAIVIAPEFLDRFPEKFGIGTTECIDVVERPMRRNAFIFAGMQFEIYYRDRRGFPFVVICGNQGNDRVIYYAYYIPVDLVTRPDHEDLDHLFELFVERFGHVIEVNGYRSRCIRGVYFRVTAESLPAIELFHQFKVENRGQNFALSVTAQVDKQVSGLRVRCALVYSLDDEAYRSWLNSVNLLKSVALDQQPSGQRVRVDEPGEYAGLSDAIAYTRGSDMRVMSDRFRELATNMLRKESLQKLRPTHPLSRLLSALNASEDEVIASDSGFRKWLYSLAELSINAGTWERTADPADLWSIIVDPLLKNRIEGRLIDESQYHDTLAELYIWGSMRQKGITAELTDDPGMPDLRLYVNSVDVVAAEVKVVHEGTVPTAVRRHIEKANRQIKRFSPDRSGIVYMFFERSEPARAEVNVSEPAPFMIPYREAAIKVLASNVFRSVASVVLVWDDYLVVGENTDGPILYAFRRQFEVLHHKSGRPTALLDKRVYEVGFSMRLWDIRRGNIARN